MPAARQNALGDEQGYPEPVATAGGQVPAAATQSPCVATIDVSGSGRLLTAVSAGP